MILSGIISIGAYLLSWIIGILPDSTGFPDEAHTAMSGLGGYLGIWSPILPIATLGTLVALVFSVEIAIFGFKGVKWVTSHIPWIGGKGN